MKFWFNNLFGLTKQEFNGILFLIILLIVVKLSPNIYKAYFLTTEPKKLVNNSFENIILADVEKQLIISSKISSNKKNIGTYFKFDPNTNGIKEWELLGLTAKQGQSILNYIDKGGKFYKPEDLKKMYVVSDDIYKEWEPYIEIVSIKDPKNNSTDITPIFESVKNKNVLIDINSADTTELKKIRGVGSAYAKRIYNYKLKLGGFYEKNQLKEVYGVDSVLYKLIASQITIDTNAIQKININTVDFNGLKSFPYLNFKEINAILNYRKQHGSYKNVDDLKKIILLKGYNFERISNYLIY